LLSLDAQHEQKFNGR